MADSLTRLHQREYMSWRAMRRRCNDPKDPQFHNYGGRGISICAQWNQSFGQFLRDMGPRPEGKTLDRINVNGNYEPTNCRWATIKEQNSNRRDTVIIERDGLALPLKDWASRLGIPSTTLYNRHKAGLKGVTILSGRPAWMKKKPVTIPERPNRGNKAGYRGVSKDGSMWKAQTRINGKKIYLGRFSSAEEAHSVYCAAQAGRLKSDTDKKEM